MDTPIELLKLNDKYFTLMKAVTFNFNLTELKSVLPNDVHRALVSAINYPEDKTFSVTVPRGYISDLRTLPEWFTNRFNAQSKWRKAFLLQDFLYEVVTSKCADGDGINALDKLMTKELVDAISVCALKSLGMGWIRRSVIHSVFKRTAVDKAERIERRGLITYMLRNRYRIGIPLKQRNFIKGPGEPIILPTPYRLFEEEHVSTELGIIKHSVLQYPNITIPLYITFS